jgi:hypothetical protein
LDFLLTKKSSIQAVRQQVGFLVNQEVTLSGSKSASKPDPSFSAAAVKTEESFFSWNGEL